MGFRKLVRPFVPEVLLRYRREHRNLHTYASFEDASRAARNDYEDVNLNKFRVDRTLLLIRGGAAPLRAGNMRRNDRGGQVVDFGGATGQYGYGLQEVLGGPVDYTVVETPGFVQEAAAFPKSVKFASEFPSSCDIFFTSGTLSYLPDPISILEQAFQMARKAVIIARNSFSEERIIRVQVSDLGSNGNGPIPAGYKNTRIAYPHQTLNEADIISLAKAMGFRLISRVKQDSGMYPYLRKIYGADLTFARVS